MSGTPTDKDKEPLVGFPYRELIGGLNWLSDNGSLNTDEPSWIISNRNFIIQERDKIVMGRQE